jgi:hypothetical protein
MVKKRRKDIMKKSMKNFNLTKDCRDKFIATIAEKLDTRDKRWMFLKLTFPNFASRIQLEGSALDTAWNIYSEFEKQQMLGSLMAHFNGQLGCDLLLELETE